MLLEPISGYRVSGYMMYPDHDRDSRFCIAKCSKQLYFKDIRFWSRFVRWKFENVLTQAYRDVCRLLRPFLVGLVFAKIAFFKFQIEIFPGYTLYSDHWILSFGIQRVSRKLCIPMSVLVTSIIQGPSEVTRHEWVTVIERDVTKKIEKQEQQQ